MCFGKGDVVGDQHVLSRRADDLTGSKAELGFPDRALNGGQLVLRRPAPAGRSATAFCAAAPKVGERLDLARYCLRYRVSSAGGCAGGIGCYWGGDVLQRRTVAKLAPDFHKNR